MKQPGKRPSLLLAWMLAAACAGLVPTPAAARAEPMQNVRAAPEEGVPAMSVAVQHLRHWVMRSADHGGRPFIVIDKPLAQLWLFAPTGELLGQAAVLLGLARGDHTVPDIGDRRIQDIRPHERTTPAGRFVAEYGRNLNGEDVVWIDYDAAVSMHRVRATHAAERRVQRLASPTPADNRISYGCVNVPAAFFEAQLRPLFRAGRAVVYVLPDTLPVETVFRAAQPWPR